MHRLVLESKEEEEITWIAFRDCELAVVIRVG